MSFLAIKTRAVTAWEKRWVIAWELAKARDPHRAAAILEHGGNVEHFRALLNEDESQWTDEQRMELAEFAATFEAVESPAKPEPEPEPKDRGRPDRPEQPYSPDPAPPENPWPEPKQP